MSERIRTERGGFYRRTIGFRPEVVEEREDHDTFSVTGGSFHRPESEPLRDWEDATCRSSAAADKPRRHRKVAQSNR